MFKALVSILVMSAALQAGAAPVQVTKTLKPEIKEKARDVLIKKERAYKCTLEGRTASKWSLQNEVYVNVTAASLQAAAELALTPFVIEDPNSNLDVVKIKVENTVFFVRDINCQPVQKSIF